MKSKLKIVSIIIIVCLLSCGCIDEDNEDKSEKSIEEENEIILHTTTLHPGNSSGHFTSMNGNVTNLTSLIVYNDSRYLRVAGDCINRWGGLLEARNFTNSTFSNLTAKYNVTIVNATLIVNYKTDHRYHAGTYIEWTNSTAYRATTILPFNNTEEITDKCILFENGSYSPSKMAMVKIRYHNPQSGFIAPAFYPDYIWIEIDYRIN